MKTRKEKNKNNSKKLLYFNKLISIFTAKYIPYNNISVATIDKDMKIITK